MHNSRNCERRLLLQSSLWPYRGLHTGCNLHSQSYAHAHQHCVWKQPTLNSNREPCSYLLTVFPAVWHIHMVIKPLLSFINWRSVSMAATASDGPSGSLLVAELNCFTKSVRKTWEHWKVNILRPSPTWHVYFSTLITHHGHCTATSTGLCAGSFPSGNVLLTICWTQHSLLQTSPAIRKC